MDRSLRHRSLRTALLGALALFAGATFSPLALADEPSPRTPDFVIEASGDHPAIAVELLTVEEGKVAIVDPSDPFFAALTPLEMSLRLDEDVTALPREEALTKFRSFLQEQVTEWRPVEREKLAMALPQIAERMREHCPDILPTRWRFLRTTGRDELSVPYTRGDCIVFPETLVASLIAQDQGTFEHLVVRKLEQLGQLVIHETFHVWSRNHPTERDTLYREFGFEPIAPVVLPDSIDRIRLTNPDGPGWGHAIRVTDDEGNACRAILLLTSKAPEFQKGYMGVIPVLSFHLYPITESDPPTLRTRDDGSVVRWMPHRVKGFAEQVGRNSAYIIHPDEILADHASYLAYPPAQIPNPELLERVRIRLGGTVIGVGKGSSSSSGKPEPASHDGGR